MSGIHADDEDASGMMFEEDGDMRWMKMEENGRK